MKKRNFWAPVVCLAWLLASPAYAQTNDWLPPGASNTSNIYHNGAACVGCENTNDFDGWFQVDEGAGRVCIGNGHMDGFTNQGGFIGFNVWRGWSSGGGGNWRGGPGSVIFGRTDGSMHFSTFTGGLPSGSNGGSLSGGIRMSILQTGKVVIGGGSLNTGGSYKLFVEQGIRTEEVMVQLKGAWPDYVFSPQYELMPLRQLEAHLQAYRHLPGMPTAAEVESAGGFELNKTAVLHQEKIEELFRYVIELNNAVEALKAENAALKAELQKLRPATQTQNN